MVKPEWPRRALREDHPGGRVVAQIKIVNGSVVDVTILSGPRIFYDEVIKAIKQYKCEVLSEEVVVPQPFDFTPQR